MPDFGLNPSQTWWVWLVFAIVFLALELSTVNLVSIWFVFGSIVAMILAFFNVHLVWQVVAFLLSSGITVFLFLYFRKKLKITTDTLERTNADRVIGKTGIVIEDIDDIRGSGLVKVDGQVWSAVSEDGKNIKKDSYVDILEIKGVKLIVSVITQDAEDVK